MITGRDLIIHILQNNLEDEEIFKNGNFLGFLTLEEAALKFGMGTETVKALVKAGFFKSIEINGKLFILDNKGGNDEK